MGRPKFDFHTGRDEVRRRVGPGRGRLDARDARGRCGSTLLGRPALLTLRDDDIACGSEVDVRVAAVYADGETAWAEASIVAERAVARADALADDQGSDAAALLRAYTPRRRTTLRDVRSRPRRRIRRVEIKVLRRVLDGTSNTHIRRRASAST